MTPAKDHGWIPLNRWGPDVRLALDLAAHWIWMNRRNGSVGVVVTPFPHLEEDLQARVLPATNRHPSLGVILLSSPSVSWHPHLAPEIGRWLLVVVNRHSHKGLLHPDLPRASWSAICGSIPPGWTYRPLYALFGPRWLWWTAWAAVARAIRRYDWEHFLADRASARAVARPWERPLAALLLVEAVRP